MTPRFQADSRVVSGSRSPGNLRSRPVSPAGRALRALKRVGLADSGQSTLSFIRGLTLVLVAVLGGVFGAIWLAERGGPVQQKVDALVRKVDTLNKQPPSSTRVEPKIKVIVTESATGSERPEKAASPPAPVPKSVRPAQPAKSAGKVGFPSLQAIRWSSKPGHTSVNLELGTAKLAQTGRLHNPERLYFDLTDTSKPPDPPGRFGSRESDGSSDDLLAAIRMARSKPRLVRVVLDLKSACDFSYKLTAKPSRSLVVELSAPAISRQPLK